MTAEPAPSTAPSTLSDSRARFPEEVAAAREYFLLARESERLGDAATALAWYGRAFRFDAKSRDLCFLYLDRLRGANAVDSASSVARECAALAGDSLAPTASISASSRDSAIAPVPPGVTFAENKLLAEVALRGGDARGALRYYRAALDGAGPADEVGDVLYVLAGLYEETGDWVAHARMVEQLLPRLGYPARLMDRLARIYARLDRPEDLVPVLVEAWERTGEPSYGLALAALHESKGSGLSLLTVVRRLALLHPGPDHEALLARAFATADRPDSALRITTRLVKELKDGKGRPDETGIRYLHASLLFDRGRYNEAHRHAEVLARSLPQAPAAHFLAGSAALELRRRGAAATLDKALALAPWAPEYRARRVYADYVALFATSGKPDSLRAAQSRAQFAARLAYQGAGDSLEPEQVLMLEGLAHARLARDLEPRGAWERPSVFSDTALVRHHRRAALARFEAILANNSGHRGALFEAGALAERLGDHERSKVLMRRLIARDTLHALAMNYLAYTIAEQDTFAPGELEEAGALLDRALALDPENGAYRDSKGWWYYRKAKEGGEAAFDAARHADLDSAATWLEAAADAAPGDPAVLDHLVQVLHARERRAEACEVLHRLRRLDPHNATYLHCPAEGSNGKTEPETGVRP